jgi:ketosteroid isomerase-like protein
MTPAAVQAWLDRYVDAWRTYDEQEIGDLFSEDAEYRFHPWDGQPLRGRAAIVRSWLEPEGPASARDEPGTWTASYRPWAVDGDRAVMVGSTTYWTDASQSQVDKVYENAWLLEFDADGRCRRFVEHYMKRPQPKG